MRRTTRLQNFYLEFTFLIYILLFVYAAVSKLLDFENFQIQIGQSPMLSAFTVLVSYGIPITEFVLASLLLIPKYRLIALYGSFLLMVMFTTYIIIIIHFSSFLPCSCGGILEQMNWTDHLIFNIGFVLVATIAILFQSKTKLVYAYLLVHMAIGIIVVILLHLLSEDIMQHRNNFVRRFPDQVHKVLATDLNFNSYYFAGNVQGKIYLGNYTAPLLLTEIDSAFKKTKEIVVRLDNMALPFRSLELRVQSNYFYVIDGTVPIVFRGLTGKWTATIFPLHTKPFSLPVVIDSTSIAYRTHAIKAESILGYTTFGTKKIAYQNPVLLQKQIDGLFDCDGTLLFDGGTKKIIYLYRYRNQFIVTDSKLNLIYRGKTIDTISRVQIKVAYNKERDEKKLSAPPLTVNKSGVVHNGLLFVHSGLIGKFEDATLWRQSSVIDIYDIQTNTYLVSFYVYHIDGIKMSRFYVTDSNFYALIGTHLVCYQLSTMIQQRFSKEKNIKI
jgi:hypothetical protein